MSCEIINPEEEIPAYLEISQFDVAGINNLPPSSDIRDVWLYVGRENLGVYQFDGKDKITIPILKSGLNTIRLDPGIVGDLGFNNVHDAYPFYENFDTVVNIVPGETIVLNPKTGYTEEANLIDVTQDDFETGLNRNYRACGGCPINLEVAARNNPEFTDLFGDSNGEAIALLRVGQGATDSVYLETRSAFGINERATQIWLEFEYRSNIIFTTGIRAQNVFYYRIQPFLPASPDGWTKVYLRLIDDFFIFNDNLAYTLIFSSPQTDGAKDYYVALDNIRIVQPEP